MRRYGLPGNVCRVALRLDGGLNTDLLRQRVATSPILDWLARVRIIRSFPFLLPRWRAAAKPRTIFHEHNEPATNGSEPGMLPSAVTERDLHAGEGPALALDLVCHADGTRHLVFSWNHALLDARGAELILRHLNAGGAVKEPPTIENLINPAQREWSLSKWWGNMKLARGSMKWLRTSGREPLFTLVPEGRPARGCRNHYRVISFSRPETELINERCQRLRFEIFRRDGARRGFLDLKPHARARFARVDRGDAADRNIEMLGDPVEPGLEFDRVVADREPVGGERADIQRDLPIPKVGGGHQRVLVDLHDNLRRVAVVGAPLV